MAVKKGVKIVGNQFWKEKRGRGKAAPSLWIILPISPDAIVKPQLCSTGFSRVDRNDPTDKNPNYRSRLFVHSI